MPSPVITREEPKVSERALACFAHGLAHLMTDLGAERGLDEGAEIIAAIQRSGARAGITGSPDSLHSEELFE